MTIQIRGGNLPHMTAGAQVERDGPPFDWGKAEVVINLQSSELPGHTIITTNVSSHVLVPTGGLRYRVPIPEQRSNISFVYVRFEGHGKNAEAILAAENSPKMRRFRQDNIPYAGFAQTVVEDAIYAAWYNNTKLEELDEVLKKVLHKFSVPKDGAATISVLERYASQLLIPGTGEQTPHRARSNWLISMHNGEGFEDLKRELATELRLFLASSPYARNQYMEAIAARRQTLMFPIS